MKRRPIIETVRLVLRPFDLADAHDVQRLVGEKDIASTTLRIAHPYKDGMAEQWIETHQEQYDASRETIFAITLRSQDVLIGSIGLEINQPNDNAEMGYWIGKPYWNLGYATEAAGAVLRYGFEVLGLNRIFADHFLRNPASGRVLQKIGMCHEGCQRQHLKKWGVFEDVVHYGVLKCEYESLAAG